MLFCLSVIVVGVTSEVDIDELVAIAGDPSRVFIVNDFKQSEPSILAMMVQYA